MTKLYFHVGSIVAALIGLTVILAWRVREGRTPVTLKKIVIPPLGMATGFSMFLVPAFRIPWAWAGIAFLIGATLLAYPLIRMSSLTLENGTVMVRRSNGFFLVVIALAAIRLAAKNYIGSYITIPQTGGIFFILAFGMVLLWRVDMFFEYRRVVAGREALSQPHAS